MPEPAVSADESDLIAAGAATIYHAFDQYQAEFVRITRRARTRFAHCDWTGAQSDAVERLDLYARVIRQAVAQVKQLLGDRLHDRSLWSSINSLYSQQWIPQRLDVELAETFFNSVTRRIFTTVGVDPNIEFVDTDFEIHPLPAGSPVYRSYPAACGSDDQSLAAVLECILQDYAFSAPYQDAPRDARLAAEELCRGLQAHCGAVRFERIEILEPVFYRSNLAYLVGRVWGLEPAPQTGRPLLPLVLCFTNSPAGVCLDAVLVDEDEVSIVFSFTRSYFHVEAARPYELIAFLKSIMPLKRIAELYISIGYNKHGKTELYRDLLHHLSISDDRFEIARGERGMVMEVFTLSSYDLVFKVIKDRMEPPKTTSRLEVMDRYDLVFKHDRAGRLVDAQEFEYLSFERRRFSGDLLDELLALAPSMVQVDERCVVIKHLYIERRLTPLNLYIKEAGEPAARSAVIDYGQAIKDLAATNVFPGDVLLKNFGVTRHGRVVFYDYDELCLLTTCKFRRVPQPRTFDDEFEADPWFYVGPLDIFPEEFRTFLGLQEPLRSLFIDHHADLFDVSFWRGMQSRHQAGEVVDIFPYPESKRLHA